MKMALLGMFMFDILSLVNFFEIRDGTIPVSRIPILAAIAGSMVTRTISRLAFQKHGRSLVTQDMLSEIGKAFTEVFEDEQPGGKL